MQLELITKAMSCQKFCYLQHYNAGMKTMQTQFFSNDLSMVAYRSSYILSCSGYEKTNHLD